VSSADLVARVRSALDEVRDPCSVAAGVPAGLVEMGLVQSLDVTDDPGGAVVRVAIRVTEPTCLMGPSFASGARARLARVRGVAQVVVELSDDPSWSPVDMTPAYRTRLAEHRRARRGSIAVVETPAGGAVHGVDREEAS
jgi:metal-sulfur cluster biosynthetic enzyme